MIQSENPEQRKRDEEREQVFGELPESSFEPADRIFYEERRAPNQNAFLGGATSQMVVFVLFALLLLAILWIVF